MAPYGAVTPLDGARTHPRQPSRPRYPSNRAVIVPIRQTFVSHIAWESEVWIAGDPDHMIHFNGERFLGPYPDVMPTKP